MFVGIRQFIQRNRRRFLFSTGVIALVYFALGYIQKKFQEYQLRLTEERFQREQIRRRFEQTQKDALYTIYSLCPALNGAVFDGLNVEEITQALQQRRLEKKTTESSGVGSTTSDLSSVTNDNAENSVVLDGRKSKNELWTELKIVSLTRLITLVYCDALLVLFTRLQLNVLARREYLEDALQLASKKHGIKKGIEMVDHADYVNEQAYLSFSWWLLNRGWIQIREKVKHAVEEVFEEITPRYELDVEEFSLLLQKTQLLIEKDFPLSELVLPPRNLENFVIQQTLDEETLSTLMKDPGNLRVLVDETAEYVSSSSSQIVLRSLVATAFGMALHAVGEAGSRTGGRVKLAVVLATTSKLAHEFKQPGSEFVGAMDRVGELDELSASVYSNFG